MLGQNQNLIDFLVLHSYPIYSENYYDYSQSNPNFQARRMLELPILRASQSQPCSHCCYRASGGRNLPPKKMQHAWHRSTIGKSCSSRRALQRKG